LASRSESKKYRWAAACRSASYRQMPAIATIPPAARISCWPVALS